MLARSGAFHLFTFKGIHVFLHWSWFLAAMILIQHPIGNYRGNAYLCWIFEYVALFGIVLMHEFGHALACKSVGGDAHEIILWPLGGVAFVSPPQRPGATLWSIAAGPLVNVALVPVWEIVRIIMETSGFAMGAPNSYLLLLAIRRINLGLLIFNLMPVYPLDGGQILRSLLWFPFGRARSLLVASIVGFLGVGALVVIAILGSDLWLGLIAVFILLNCWQGLRQALAMARVDDSPVRFGFVCPSCHTAPRAGKFWGCGNCHTAFDTFETRAQCPKCGAVFGATRCQNCGNSHPLSDWSTTRLPPPPPPMG